MSDHGLPSSMWATLRESSAIDLVAGVAEVGIDAVTSGVLKDVPILGSIAGIWKTGAQVKDLLFVRKLCEFLRNLGELPLEERQEFADRMDADPKYSQRVGEHVLLAIDRIDDTLKARALAYSFSAFVRGKISYGRMTEFSLAIDRCLMADLARFTDTSDRLELPGPIATRLSACGLLEVNAIPTIRPASAGNYYGVTELGREFYEHVAIRFGGKFV